MSDHVFDGVPNLRDAIKLWQALGGKVSKPSRTGEVLFDHPQVGRVRANCRRKDSPRALVVKLRKLMQLGDGKGAA